jgi:hypothetical protein
VDDADGAARANVKATTKAEFDDKIKAVETLKKAHQAKIKAHFGVYKKDYAAFAQGVYTNRIAKLRDDAAAALEARLKTVGVTDTVTRKAITDDIHRQLRVAVKQVNQEQTAAEKGVRQQSLKARRELEKQWRKNDREMAQQLDTDLNEIAAGFKDLTPSEFADAVHIATVKDVPDEHISPVMREVMDRVNKVMDSPEFKNYLTRVYNQPKLSADNGAGFIHAVSQYFIGQKVAPDEAKQIATEALNKIQGLGATARIVGMSNRPVTQAAPQLERELAVPDSVIAPWLLNDADSIALSYARSIGSRLELAKISKDYGEPGAWRLGGDRADITQRYAERIRASNPKEAERLKKEHDQVQRDLEATAHRILGIYDLPEDPTRFTTRLANVLKHTNLLSRMGGMMSASFSDVAAPALAMGLSRAYGPALAALAQGQLKAAVKMSARQLQAWGTACEMLTPLWSHAPAELGDIAMPAMQAAGQVFTHMTGISVWNTFGKSLSGVMIQHDLLRLVQRLAGKDLKTLSKSDLNALGDLTRYGIRTDMIDELARQPTQDFGSLKLADTDNWSNPELVNQYRNALVKMVDAFIITPSAGDKFRFIKGPWPGLLAQFQSFAMAAHNKAMVPFMQDPNMVRQATALTAAAFMGAFTYASRMALSGRYDQVDKQIKEKDYYGLARQVVANSSLLTIPSAVENMAGSFLGAQGAGRFASSGTEAMGGPSAGLLDNVWDLGKAVGPNGEYTASTLHKTRNMVPYQNTWVANLLLNPSSGHGLPGLGGEEAIVKKLGLKEKPK